MSAGHTSRSDCLAVAERWVRSSRMPHVGYAYSITNGGPRFHSNISSKSSPNPSLEPSRSLYQPPLFLYMIIHSSAVIHTRIHTFIHARIHSSHTSEASHMQSNASQRSVLHHEAVVASFNMSNDCPGFEGRPMKGSRPPHVKQSQGRKHR